MKHWQRRLQSAASVLVLTALLATLTAAAVSHAATTTAWSAIQLTGTSGAWTGSMQVPAKGFPSATIASDSLAGQVGVQTGANTWLSGATPPGALFGSSKNQPYLLLKPRANNQNSPSTTTYTFERPTPPSAWAFVLGDIDADRAVISALGANGQPVSGADLGWQGGFNYCAAAGGPSCAGVATDVASWNPNTGEIIGNAAGNDSTGASGWFQPTVPITKLTIVYYLRSGLASYQTWFASVMRNVSGSVSLVGSDGNSTGQLVPGVTVTLFDGDGNSLETTETGADGRFTFDGFAATDGYRVEVTGLPTNGQGFEAGLEPFDSTPAVNVDLSTSDVTDVNFDARAKPLASASGTVRASDGAPVSGAQLTIAAADGTIIATASSGADGAYRLDRIPPGDHTVTVVAPPEYLVSEIVKQSISIKDQPVTGIDFTLLKAGTIGGLVTDGDGSPVPDIDLTIEGPTPPVTVTTDPRGEYLVPKLPPGNYHVNIRIPEGYFVEEPRRPITLTDTGSVTGDTNFVLRPVVAQLPQTGRGEPPVLNTALAITAVTLGASALLLARRRQLGQR